MPCLNIHRSVGRRGDLLFFAMVYPEFCWRVTPGFNCAAPPVLRIDCVAIGILPSFRYNCRADRPITLNRYERGALDPPARRKSQHAFAAKEYRNFRNFFGLSPHNMRARRAN